MYVSHCTAQIQCPANPTPVYLKDSFTIEKKIIIITQTENSKLKNLYLYKGIVLKVLRNFYLVYNTQKS